VTGPADSPLLPNPSEPSWMRFDTVVPDRDLPEHGLRRGDLGAVDLKRTA
jgi:hypothetical protein